MRTIFATLIASTVAVGGFSVANAADVVTEVPQAPVSYDQPAVKDWSGAYVGGTATYGKGRARSGSYNASALGGGVYGGYNWQNGQIVYGAEADVNYDGKDGRAGVDRLGGPVSGKQGVNGSIRGRVGYDMNPVLVYGTAGLAATDTKVSNSTSSDDRVAAGYTVGAGVEALVTDNITARLEYRYSDYQKKNYALDTGSVKRGFDDHSIKAGLGVKF